MLPKGQYASRKIRQLSGGALQCVRPASEVFLSACDLGTKKPRPQSGLFEISI